MADRLHLTYLKIGLESWNAWRKTRPEAKVDLIKADLSALDLIEANLSRADLSGTNLKKANLSRADLNGASLSEANLSGASLIKTDLSEANLSGADLRGTNLEKANLEKANLSRTNLNGANLNEANLSRSNLTGADLKRALLNQAVLVESNITGVNLWGTARDNWIIDNIKCDYVFWDQKGNIREPQERNFEPCEFEKLYKDLPKIDFTFLEDFTVIDIIFMDQIVQEINIQHPEHELKLESLHHRGKPRAVFTIRDRRQADMIYCEIRSRYDTKIKVIEGERDTYKKALGMALKEPRTIIEKLDMGDIYKIKGQAGVVGPGAHAHDINFNQVWDQVSRDIDLTKLLAELVILREAIQREAKSSEQYHALAAVSDAETAAKAGKGSKVMEHLKKAGKWTFDVARDIGTDVAAEVIKKSLGL